MAAEYRLVSYADGKGAKAGALIGERIFPAEQLIVDARDKRGHDGSLRSARDTFFFHSFPRKRESRTILSQHWIPACAGMSGFSDIFLTTDY